jgi:hypothetical protein
LHPNRGRRLLKTDIIDNKMENEEFIIDRIYLRSARNAKYGIVKHITQNTLNKND